MWGEAPAIDGAFGAWTGRRPWWCPACLAGAIAKVSRMWIGLPGQRGLQVRSRAGRKMDGPEPVCDRSLRSAMIERSESGP